MNLFTLKELKEFYGNALEYLKKYKKFYFIKRLYIALLYYNDYDLHSFLDKLIIHYNIIKFLFIDYKSVRIIIDTKRKLLYNTLNKTKHSLSILLKNDDLFTEDNIFINVSDESENMVSDVYGYLNSINDEIIEELIGNYKLYNMRK